MTIRRGLKYVTVKVDGLEVEGIDKDSEDMMLSQISLYNCEQIHSIGFNLYTPVILDTSNRPFFNIV